jgi:hypothetical protein
VALRFLRHAVASQLVDHGGDGFRGAGTTAVLCEFCIGCYFATESPDGAAAVASFLAAVLTEILSI